VRTAIAEALVSVATCSEEERMNDGGVRPSALNAGEGGTYNYGIDFTVKAGERGAGFVSLPRGIEYGYTVRGEGEVRLLVVTSPAEEDAVGDWGGFVADLETTGEPRGGK
jgi:hypothetical protein